MAHVPEPLVSQRPIIVSPVRTQDASCTQACARSRPIPRLPWRHSCLSVPRQVPDYLVSRQEEWEREETRRKAEAPDPSCPPGMKLMPEDDRLQTLRQLQV